MVLYYVILQDHVIKVHMTSWVGTSHDEAPSCQLQQSQALVVKMFFLSYSLARARYQRVMQLFGWETFLVSHHPAKFGGYTEWQWRYNGFNFSRNLAFQLKCLEVSHHPAKFGSQRHCGGGDAIVLVCHVISQDNGIKSSCDLQLKTPHDSAKFGGLRHCDRGDMTVLLYYLILEGHAIMGL